ncbi:hypothetical protein ASG01_03775 [Chryseobacterium sp. Leaf180]|uniref:hypothetical protein n=1 Tax=Chryseobacterium sp. Leaf180 TaxID=1736289 RepID=UPI0006FDC5A5|nr:hypothetical protein [Chryseobacterium sp. Leaf180]KQR95685.1 hypothetical protein ASG01_03775 [Chryseobacterium sp. Leaf180]
MTNTFEEKIYRVLFVVILPFLLFFMAYYGFESSYVKIKTVENVPGFMFSSVYAYRVLPNLFSVETTDFLRNFTENYLPAQKDFILKSGSYFYHATFLVNVLFFLLSSYLIKILLEFSSSNVSNIKIMHLLAVFFLVIAQYVPTNCDMMAVFLYLAGIFLSLRYLKLRKISDFVLLLAVIFVSTLVRETACLNIAFFAALTINLKNLSDLKSKNFIETGALVIAFVVPYVALRLLIPQDASFAEGVYLKQNFSSPYNLAGLIFGILSVYFFYHLSQPEERKILKNYLFFAVPYLLMIALVGLFWETRLFLPIILTALLTVSGSFSKKNVSA